MTDRKQKYCQCCGSYLERFYSVNSLSEMFDCSKQFFRNLIRDRRIGFMKVGRLVRIPEKEVRKILIYFPGKEEMVGKYLNGKA